MKRSSYALVITLAGFCIWGSLQAGPPPSLINYQGVLRDAAGKPVTGTYSVLFSFYDNALDANNQILTDFQTVTVSQGLFNVHLGGGTVADGLGRGTYVQLSEVFRDYEEVWLQLDIAPAGGVLETLLPRVRVVSSAYALRAGHADSAGTATLATSALNAVTAQTAGDAATVGGRDPSQFLDMSGNSQVKQGKLGLGFGADPTHWLTIFAPTDDALRLIGAGNFGSQARINFGDGDFVYIDEDSDDFLTLYALQRTAIMGGNVGIGTLSPTTRLDVSGKIKSSSSSGGFVFPDASEQMSAAAGASAHRTPLQIAAKRWQEISLRPQAIVSLPNMNLQEAAFDGSSIWASGSNGSGAIVMKVRPGDGEVLSTFQIPGADNFTQLAVDGQFVWAAGLGSTALYRINPNTGASTAFPIGFLPTDILSDGLSVWVTDNTAGFLKKVRASDGAILGTFSAGTDPRGIAFDGTAIWVASFVGAVRKFRATDGALLGTFPVPGNLTELIFDGSSIWVSQFSNDTLTRLRATDGAVIGTFTVGNGPSGLAFDGYHVWVSNVLDDTLTKLRVSDGSVVGVYSVSTQLFGALAFDGISIWATDTLVLRKL